MRYNAFSCSMFKNEYSPPSLPKALDCLTYEYMYVRRHVCTYVRMSYVCRHIYIRVYLCIYMYMCLCTSVCARPPSTLQGQRSTIPCGLHESHLPAQNRLRRVSGCQVLLSCAGFKVVLRTPSRSHVQNSCVSCSMAPKL